MPAVRLSKRRRSSLAISFNPAKAGIYGISRPVTFAPNVTPISFVDPEASSSSSTPEPGSPMSALFPPSETPAPPPTRRRVPPGKRRSMGYIPRPPNAFMLFRADFVRQKHVPGTIETNHGSLSKIIGNCWRALPLEEKRVWELKAKHAKAEHKARYPEYRFRPVHNKNKEKKKEKPPTTVEDERRCEEVAQLLLEGKKGDELAAAVRSLDLMRNDVVDLRAAPTRAQAFERQHRRSSSVPLPNDYIPHFGTIALPSAPFFLSASATSSFSASCSRPPSPMDSMARQQQRMMLGNRRASSARPAVLNRSWTMPLPGAGFSGMGLGMGLGLQRDDSPLPEVDTSLFNPSFLGGGSFSFGDHEDGQLLFSGMGMNGPSSSHQHQHQHQQDQNASFGPLDMNIAPHELLQHQPQMYSTPSTTTSASASSSNPDLALDPLSSWMHPDANHPYPHPHSHDQHSQHHQNSAPNSYPSTAYSGSPAPSSPPLTSLPAPLPVHGPVLHAPQPQQASSSTPHAEVFADMSLGMGMGMDMDMWKEFGGGSYTSDLERHQQYVVDAGLGLGLGLDFDPMVAREVDVLGVGVGVCAQQQQQQQQHHQHGHGMEGMEGLFEGQGMFAHGLEDGFGEGFEMSMGGAGMMHA